MHVFLTHRPLRPAYVETFSRPVEKCAFAYTRVPTLLPTNKKSEPMHMRRARAYSSSCSQVILFDLYPFHRNSRFCMKIMKTPLFKVQGHSRSSMLTFLRRLSPVLVAISSMSVPICNHLHARQASSA